MWQASITAVADLGVTIVGLSAGALQATGAIAVAVITGLVAVLVARRSTSGSISTSDAKTLWEESQEMRRELREEVVKLRSKEEELQSRLRVAEEANHKLRERVAVLEDRVRALGGSGDD